MIPEIKWHVVPAGAPIPRSKLKVSASPIGMEMGHMEAGKLWLAGGINFQHCMECHFRMPQPGDGERRSRNI